MNFPLIVSAGMLVRAALLDRPYGYSSYSTRRLRDFGVHRAVSRRTEAARVDVDHDRVAILFNLLTPIALKGRAPQEAGGKYLLSGGLLICPTCGGHFESFIPPWKPGGVYCCATRRRKPGARTNTLTLPMRETDDTISRDD